MKVAHLQLVFGIVLSAIVTDGQASEEVRGFSGHQTYVVIKADRDFIGGRVEVYNANHTLIVSQEMKKRKVSIDFGSAMIGEYTIRLVKDSNQQEYHFLKA